MSRPATMVVFGKHRISFPTICSAVEGAIALVGGTGKTAGSVRGIVLRTRRCVVGGPNGYARIIADT